MLSFSERNGLGFTASSVYVMQSIGWQLAQGCYVSPEIVDCDADDEQNCDYCYCLASQLHDTGCQALLLSSSRAHLMPFDLFQTPFKRSHTLFARFRIEFSPLHEPPWIPSWPCESIRRVRRINSKRGAKHRRRATCHPRCSSPFRLHSSIFKLSHSVLIWAQGKHRNYCGVQVKGQSSTSLTSEL